jgi:hypothetical protein
VCRQMEQLLMKKTEADENPRSRTRDGHRFLTPYHHLPVLDMPRNKGGKSAATAAREAEHAAEALREAGVAVHSFKST